MGLKMPNNLALGRRWFGTNWFANDVPRHLILFNAQSLHFLAEQQGFKEQTIRTFSTPPKKLF